VLDVLWAATSVAVVGASARAGAPGHSVLSYLERFGYAGRVIAINPNADQIGDRPAWPSVAAYRAATGNPVDLAVVLVPASACLDAITDCADAGVAVAIVGSSGFAEVGPEGRALQSKLVAVARAGGMRLVGPNCIGALGPQTGLVASFSPLFGGAETRLLSGGAETGLLSGGAETGLLSGGAETGLLSGGAETGLLSGGAETQLLGGADGSLLAPDSAPRAIGFASASGALGFGTVSLALDRGLPLRAAVSTGNEADVSALEVLTALARDPECGALLGYAESLSDADGLRALAAAASEHGKPVALLVGGVSEAGARAAASHTGALATGERVVDGVLRQFGIERVNDVDELLDVGDAYALIGGAVGDRVAVITTSGGSGILATDAIARQGLRLADLSPSTRAELAQIVPAYGSAANPVDVTATVMSDRSLVGRALHAVAGDSGVDALVVCFCVLVGADVDAIVDALAEVKQRFGKPVLVARTGAEHLAPQATAALRAAGVPSYPTPGRAVRAVAALHRSRPRPGIAATADGVDSKAPGSGEAELKAALAAAGIRVPIGRVVTDEASAVAACPERAVFKVVAPGLVHKSDVGGVLLGIDAERAGEAYHQLMAVPGAAGVLVEEQVPTGIEVLVGVADSPLGRILSVGVGGVFTEVVDDVAIRLLPVGEPDVREMIAQTRVGAMLSGLRGAPPANLDALVELVVAVARLAADWPGDLDLNPVVVTPREAIVLDAALSVTS
jgi:acyl-CoA synthetase (NDP forming)